MNIIRRFVSFATQTINPQRWLAAIKRKAVRVEVLAISLLLMPVILVVADHLPFIDVPSGAFYHDAVSAVYGARITTGTTPTTFSPEDLVTRGQMAVFLHRGLGRVAYASGQAILLSSDSQDVRVSTINTGGAPGGTGFLKVDAVFTANNTSATACPCRIVFFLSVLDGGGQSPAHTVTLYDDSEGVTSSASGALTMAFPLPTGSQSQTVRLRAYIADSAGVVGPNSISAYGEITALWVPFGARGGNMRLNAASASPDDAPPEPEPDAKPDAQR